MSTIVVTPISTERLTLLLEHADEMTPSPLPRLAMLRPLGLHHVSSNSAAGRGTTRRGWRELEPDYVLEEAGQAVRFVSRTYLDDLLTGWRVVMLDHLEMAHARTNVPFKRVWRVAARA